MSNFELSPEQVIALYALTMADKAQDKENESSYLLRLLVEDYLVQAPVIDEFNTLVKKDRDRQF